jgi:hypothetical protein
MGDWLVQDFTIFGVQNWIVMGFSIILIGIAIAAWPRR